MEHFEKLFSLLREWERLSLSPVRRFEISVQYNIVCAVPLVYLYDRDRLVYCLGGLDEPMDWIGQVVKFRRDDAKQRVALESQWSMYQTKEL